MDYVDLYLLHMPVHFKKDVLHKEIESRDVEPTDAELFQIKINTVFKPWSGDTIAVNKELWQGMERCVELGLTKAIGVSNFSINKLEELLLHARIPPAVNQVCVPSHLLLLSHFLSSHFGHYSLRASVFGGPGGLRVQFFTQQCENWWKMLWILLISISCRLAPCCLSFSADYELG